MKSEALNNVKKLYILTGLTNLWFITGNWLYFYRLYMSDRQIGVLDGLAFGVGLLAEIPSGALADLLGRKNQLRLGLLMMALGSLTQGFAHAYAHILLGMLLFTIGMAFVSGSDDALVYDSLDAAGESKKWKRIITRKYQVTLTVTLASFLVGALLYVVHFRLPFIFAGVGTMAAVFVASSMKEAETPKEKFSLGAYAKQNFAGMQYFTRRYMWLYAFMAVVILGVGCAFEMGVIKPLMLDTFGYHANAQAVINTIVGLAAVLALSRLDWLRKRLGEKLGLVTLALLMGAGFLASAFPIGRLGLIAFLAIYVINTLVAPWLNDVVQHEVPSSHRATALSTLALLQRLPFVLLSPLAGSMSAGHTFPLFLGGIAFSIFLAVAVMLLFGILHRNIRRRMGKTSPVGTDLA